MYLDIFAHKDIPLYMVTLPYGIDKEHTEYFTRIPWGEYKRIRFAERFNSMSTYELKLKIFRDYTVRAIQRTEYEIELLPAGIVDTISNLIMYVSDSGMLPDAQGNVNIPGFTNRLNLYRKIASTNVEYQMYTIICLVFKGYTFEMLDRLPFDRIASLFANAEKHLVDTGVLKTTLQIFDPNTSIPTTQKLPSISKDGGSVNSEENSIIQQMIKMKEQEKKKEEMQKQMEKEIKPVKVEAPKKEPVNISTQKENVSYIPPKDKKVVSNGVEVNVPGIKIDNNNKYGGFEKEDFDSLPTYTDDEVLAIQLEMGIPPAGYEIILARQDAQRAAEAKVIEDNGQRIITKKRFKRK